jgi:hypothetical protein
MTMAIDDMVKATLTGASIRHEGSSEGHRRQGEVTTD